MARYNKFDKTRDDPFPISRSGIDQFLRCPRTFVLHRKYGVKPPSMAPLTLAIATDHLLKNEFDVYREKQSSEHPIFRKYDLKVVPYQHTEIETWRQNFKGIRYLDEGTNLEVFGAVDDVWEDINSKELYIVDYKSTSKQGDPNIETGWGLSYKKQMEIYQWLFRKNDFPVSDRGYFLYVNGVKGDNKFYSDHKGYEDVGFMEFNTTLIPYIGNIDWVSDTLMLIKKALMNEKLPEPNKSWDENRYFYERLQLERELGEI
ncbi:MAG: hypothetical protein CMF69_07990 [Magnetovibrio sp.]|nr:hypothetical protein [Magnetovibrio sp.]